MYPIYTLLRPLPVSAEQSPPPLTVTRGKGKGRSVALVPTASMGRRAARARTSDGIIEPEMMEMEEEVLMVEEPELQAESQHPAPHLRVPRKDSLTRKRPSLLLSSEGSTRAAKNIGPDSTVRPPSPAVSEPPTAVVAAPLSPEAPAVLSPGPAASISSSVADHDLLARLPELLGFLPLLHRLSSVLPGLASRQTNLESTATTTSASLDNLWAEVGALDGRLTDLGSTVDNLKGSVDNLWKELDNLDGAEDGFVRLADMKAALAKLETSWENQFRKIAEAVAARPAAASTSKHAGGHVAPAPAVGKRARVDSGLTSTPATSSPFGLTGLGRPNGQPLAKRQRVVSELAVERLIDDNDEMDDEEADPLDGYDADEIIVVGSRSPPAVPARSTPVRPAPPSTPPARASPALAGLGVDPTFTPSTSASASATKAAAAAAAAAHHQVAPFPLFATSPKPPRDVPTSPTFESPRRTATTAAGVVSAGLTLTPGRTLFSSGGGAETPRSLAARARQQGMLPPGEGMNLTPGRRLAYDLAATTSSSAGAAGMGSPARPGSVTTNTAGGAPTAPVAHPRGLSLLPSLPLDSTTSLSASSPHALTPPAQLNPVSLPAATVASDAGASARNSASSSFPFPMPPTPPRALHRLKHKPAVPPTPPAPRTMFGTERDRDDRFGDDE